MRVKNGFSLLEVLFSLQIWLLILLYSAFLIQNISKQHAHNLQTFHSLNYLQNNIEQLKNLPWAEIKSFSEKEISVETISTSLKKIKISTQNIILETIIFKDAL